LHEDYLRDPALLEQRVMQAASPVLGPLVEQWQAWLENPAVLSAKTRRPYAAGTIRRYAASWDRFFASLPKGRDSTMADLTKGWLLDFRRERKRAGVSGSTVNRDLVALSAFYSWCETEAEMTLQRLPMPHELEPHGRERWLNADELHAFLKAVPDEWRPFFTLLPATGLRLGEVVAKDPSATALLWTDVRLADGRITVVDRGTGNRRLKSATSARDVPIAGAALEELARHRVAYPGGPAEAVFRHPFTYRQARHVFLKAIKAVGLHDLRIHDLRHTFGVHAAQAGVPLPRLQKLMGHATPAMTMRYMAHAPGAYFAEDAARVARSQSGELDREADATRKALLQRRLDTA
jgi:integrase